MTKDEILRALSRAGFAPGTTAKALDAAVRRFQKAHALLVDGDPAWPSMDIASMA